MDVDDTRLEAMTAQPLLTRDYETRPALVYERLRQRHGPVAPVDLLGVPAWLVLGYRESLQVLQDDDAWPKGLENWRARSEGRVPADWPLGPSLEVNHVLIQGGPGYQPLRTAWDAALKSFQDPRHPQTKRLKAAVTAHADELITLLGQGGGRGVAAWRSSPFMRGLRSLPVRYELASPVPALTPDGQERTAGPASDTPDTPDTPDVSGTVTTDQAVQRGSSLWRYLTGLIRTGR